MATTDLSSYDHERVPSGEGLKVGIAVSEWNIDITEALLKGAIETLEKHGVKSEDIEVQWVPGSFELVHGSKRLLDAVKPDVVIAIGCVIRGETEHFTFVCEGVTQGIVELNLHYDQPTIYCVLTDNTKQQSIDRSGGKHGNKGVECAVAALKMARL